MNASFKKIGIVLALFLGFIFLLWKFTWQKYEETEYDIPPKKIASFSKLSRSIVKTNNSPYIKNECAEKNTSPINNQPAITELQPQEISKTLLWAVNDNENEFVNTALDGNIKTSNAAFDLLRYCMPLGENALPREVSTILTTKTITALCAKFPEQLQKNPLKILEQAANKGSLDAKLRYLMNAESILKISQHNGTKYSEDEKLIIMKTAEKYGVEAASNGIEDAYLFMANAYYKGMFGERNFIKAYAFTIPMSKKNQDSEVTERVHFLYKELTMPQVKEAEIIAFGKCQSQNQTSTSLSNPFSL